MVHGEPGVGNTALLEYLAGRPRQTGVIGQGVHGRHGAAAGATVDAISMPGYR
jgi:hypothetical protein